jgi:hypothetical protein
MTKVLRR